MAFGFPEWGIFDQSGGIVLPADSVFGVEFLIDHQLSDYPQEDGAFFTYNKVQLPYTAKVTFLVGLDRAGFLDALQTAVDGLDLFSVVTPDFTYPSANLIRYSYRRIAREGGVSMLRVEVTCQQVRIVDAAATSNTRSTNGASSQSNGTSLPTTWQQNVTAVPPT
jgi:hypothetical protein